MTVEEAIKILSEMPKNWELVTYVGSYQGDVKVINIQQDKDDKLAVIRLETK